MDTGIHGRYALLFVLAHGTRTKLISLDREPLLERDVTVSVKNKTKQKTEGRLPTSILDHITNQPQQRQQQTAITSTATAATPPIATTHVANKVCKNADFQVPCLEMTTKKGSARPSFRLTVCSLQSRLFLTRHSRSLQEPESERAGKAKRSKTNK